MVTRLKKFLQGHQGAIAVMAAFVIPLLIGFLTLSIDFGSLFDQKRKLQQASDTSAINGAWALVYQSSAQAYNYALDAANKNSFSSTTGTFTFNNPPSTGAFIGDPLAVEVKLSQPGNLRLLKYFGIDSITLNTRSVASTKILPICALTSSASVSGVTSSSALTLSGGANVLMNNCGIGINATGSAAMNIVGNSTLTTDFVAIVGSYKSTSNANLNIKDGIDTGVPPIQDPFINLKPPSFSGCTTNNYSTKSKVTLNPGVYCGGMSLTGKANVTLNPGVYIIDRGSLSLGAQSQMTGEDVTFILTSSTNSNYPTINIAGGASTNLSAPTTGQWANFLFFEDRRAPGLTHSVTGGSAQILSGILYFPSSSLKYAGSTSAAGSVCVQLAANTLTFTGGATLGSSCSTESAFKIGKVKLVE